MEESNLYDKYAVAVVRAEEIVGHGLWSMSKIFIRGRVFISIAVVFARGLNEARNLFGMGV